MPLNFKRNEHNRIFVHNNSLQETHEAFKKSVKTIFGSDVETVVRGNERNVMFYNYYYISTFLNYDLNAENYTLISHQGADIPQELLIEFSKNIENEIIWDSLRETPGNYITTAIQEYKIGKYQNGEVVYFFSALNGDVVENQNIDLDEWRKYDNNDKFNEFGEAYFIYSELRLKELTVAHPEHLEKCIQLLRSDDQYSYRNKNLDRPTDSITVSS